MKKIITLFIILSCTFSLHAQLTIDFTWCPVYDTSLQVCCIQFENLTVDSGGGTIGGYIWDFGDGDTSSLSDPMHCYPFTGTFIVYLTVFYNGNPVGPTSHTLTLTHLDTTGCNCDSLIGVNEIDNRNFSFTISPNPIHEKATLTLHSARDYQLKDAEIKIYNSLGAIQRSEKVALNKRQEIILERKLLTQGIYYFEINTTEAAKIARGKFVIE